MSSMKSDKSALVSPMGDTYVLVPKSAVKTEYVDSKEAKEKACVVSEEAPKGEEKAAVFLDHNSFTHSPGCPLCSECAKLSVARASSMHAPRRVKRKGSGDSIKATITTANTIAVGTSSVLNTALALAVNGASEFASFASLYDEYKVTKVVVELNAVRPASSSAAAQVYFCAYDPTTSSGKTYDLVADYSTSHLLGFNATHCKHRQVCHPIGEVQTSTYVVNKTWNPCSNAANYISGTFLLSNTDALTGTTLNIYYKVRFFCEFRMRQG